MTAPRIVVIGAGPTGLGAAWRMEELGHQEWQIFESSARPGGLASSVVDDEGFTWDLGGHVLFSHYGYFDALMLAALGDQWVEHVRDARVWIRGRWVAYPLQNNLSHLPSAERFACLAGLIKAQVGNTDSRAAPVTFDEWLRRAFGQRLCDLFMLPYNFKVWAYPPDDLDVGWMGERVASVDLRRLVLNTLLGREDGGWGPNSTFRFPLKGGTGAIWRGIGSRLPRDRVHLRSTVVGVKTRSRKIVLESGDEVPYDHLLSTMPLDRLLAVIDSAPDFTSYAKQFKYSSTHIIGIGIAGVTPAELRQRCWMYFSEPEIPFYRATVFSNYSRFNVPRPGQQWSLMAEVSESPEKPVVAKQVVDQTIEGFRKCGLIPEGARLVSRWHRRLEHGYPTPWLGRDAVLSPVHDELSRHEIYSRGRFGAWKYEVSNQDHSVIQGVEAVGRILREDPEYTFHGDMRDWI